MAKRSHLITRLPAREKQLHFETLYEGLKRFSPEFPQVVMTDVAAYCEYVFFKKNAVLLDYGEVCDCVYFCVSGLVTSLEKEEGKEFNCWFMSDGDVMIAIESFFMQTRSQERLLALEETECLMLRVDDLNMLREKHPSFHFVELMLTRYYYQQTFNRTKWIRKTAGEKFQLLNAHYPDIIKRVTKVALASFLGISRKRLNEIMIDHPA